MKIWCFFQKIVFISTFFFGGHNISGMEIIKDVIEPTNYYADKYTHEAPKDLINKYIKLFDKAREINPTHFRKEVIPGLFEMVQEKAFPLVKQSMTIPESIYQELNEICNQIDKNLNYEGRQNLVKRIDEITEKLPVDTISFARIRAMFNQVFKLAQDPNVSQESLNNSLQKIRNEINEVYQFIQRCNERLNKLWHSISPLNFEDEFAFVPKETQKLLPNGVQPLQKKGLTSRDFQQINFALASLLDIYKSDRGLENWDYSEFETNFMDDVVIIVYLHPNKKIRTRHLGASSFNNTICNEQYPIFMGAFDIHDNKELRQFLLNKELTKSSAHWNLYGKTSLMLDHDLQHSKSQKKLFELKEYQKYIDHVCTIRQGSFNENDKKILENGLFMMTHELPEGSIIHWHPREASTFIDFVKNHFKGVLKRYDFAKVTKHILMQYQQHILKNQKEDSNTLAVRLKLQSFATTLEVWQSQDKNRFDTFVKRYMRNQSSLTRLECEKIIKIALRVKNLEPDQIDEFLVDRFPKSQEDEITNTFDPLEFYNEEYKILNNDYGENTKKVLQEIEIALAWLDNQNSSSESTFLHNPLTDGSFNNGVGVKNESLLISSLVQKQIEKLGYPIDVLESTDEGLSIRLYKLTYRDIEQLFKVDDIIFQDSQKVKRKKNKDQKTLAYYIQYYDAMNKDLEMAQESFWHRFGEITMPKSILQSKKEIN